MSSITFAPAAEATRCPICGAADRPMRKRGYYVKCTACKVAFRPQQEQVAEPGEYWETEFWTDEEITKRKNRAPVFREAFRVLHHYRPAGGAVLDIGCGIGTFLAICRERGWDVTGVEPTSIADARREYGLMVKSCLQPICSRAGSSTRFLRPRCSITFPIRWGSCRMPIACWPMAAFLCCAPPT